MDVDDEGKDRPPQVMLRRQIHPQSRDCVMKDQRRRRQHPRTPTTPAVNTTPTAVSLALPSSAPSIVPSLTLSTNTPVLCNANVPDAPAPVLTGVEVSSETKNSKLPPKPSRKSAPKVHERSKSGDDENEVRHVLFACFILSF